MWWDLKMDPKRNLTLTCAPSWAQKDRPKGDEAVPWRDHWMQAIYYPLSEVRAGSKGQHMTLVSNHDEYSFWFDVKTGPKEE